MRKYIHTCLFLVWCLLLVRQSYAGVTAIFGDFILENLPIGESLNLRALKSVPFIIVNKGDVPVDGTIEVMVPTQKKLKEGYEPIPDPEWIKVVPNKMRLGPGERGVSDVIINIPNDPKLIGKHYQAQFLCTGINVGPQTQVTIATGAETRIRFSLGTMGPNALRQEKQRKIMYSLNFEFDPLNIKVKDPIELGRKIDLRKEKGVKLSLINKADDAIKLTLHSILYDEKMYGSSEGYIIGDPSFLEVTPKKLKLNGETIEKVYLTLKIPKEEKYKDKKYIFLIKAEIGSGVPIEYFSKLFVTTGE